MSELSPRARDLVYAGRAASQPTAADRRRIEEALRARLGASVLPAQVVNVSLAARVRWPFAASAVVGAILLGSAVLFAFRQEPQVKKTERPPQVTQVVTLSPALGAAPAAEPPATPAPPAAVQPEPRVHSSLPKEDPLAREVALLYEATGDLHAGRASDALKVLDEHRRKFPNGILSEERRAARVQALCSLGRSGEAETELAELDPQPLAAVRAKQFCGGSARLER